MKKINIKTEVCTAPCTITTALTLLDKPSKCGYASNFDLWEVLVNHNNRYMETTRHFNGCMFILGLCVTVKVRC